MFTIKKSIISMALLISSLGLGMVSCDKDSSSTSTTSTITPEVNVSSELSCSIVGSLNESFEANRVIVSGSSAQYMIMATSLDVTKNMIMYLYNVKSDTKSLDLNSMGGILTFTVTNPVNVNDTKLYKMTQGTITITQNTDKLIKGTFVGKTSSDPSSTGYLEVKNGSFTFAK